MAHMIDFSNDRANIAYINQEPWHGLGQKLTEGADLETWRSEAGLDWHVERAPVFYNGGLARFDGRDVLYRSDTEKPLSIVSDGYRIVQPSQIFAFFKDLVDIGGFVMETAGSLSNGKRIWALAKVGDGVEVIDHDVVKPYLLLATSFDGTLATTAKFTAVRVVCHNTLTISTGGFDGQSYVGPAEKDVVTEKAVSAVKVNHSETFDADRVRQDLGIVKNAWERFLVDARALAGRPITRPELDDFLVDLIKPYCEGDPDKARASRGYKRIAERFENDPTNRAFAGANRWAALNAVTAYVDHERGRTDNSRMESAWFGTGNALKTRAAEVLAVS